MMTGSVPYETLLEHVPDALLVEEEGEQRYRVVNAAAERLLQFTRSELLSLGPDDVIHPADAARLARVRDHLVGQAAWHGQVSFRRKDGSLVRTDATLVRIVVDGHVLVQGLFRDPMEQTSEAWVHDALLRAHEVQHQLNNRLALITGYAEILAQDPRLPADLQEAAREALAGGLGAVEAGKRLIACFTSDRY